MPTPYGQLTDEERLRLLNEQRGGEQSAYGSLIEPAAVSGLPYPVGGRTFHVAPETYKDPVTGANRFSPGGIAQSFAPPGTTPEQYASAQAGTYSAQHPLVSEDAAALPFLQRTRVENALATEATANAPSPTRMAGLQAVLQQLHQTELMRALSGNEGGGATTSYTLNPKGEVTTHIAAPPKGTAKSYADFYAEGQRLGLGGADLARYAQGEMNKLQAAGAAGKVTATGAAQLATDASGASLAERIAGAKAGATKLSPEAVDQQARLYISSGQMPAGFGMAQARVQILNRVQEIAQEQGSSVGELLANQAGFKANTAELAKTQTMRGTIMPFLLTAQKNLDFASQLSDAVRRSDIPLVNQLVLPYKVRVEGAADVAGLNAAMRVGINETARVLASATASGVQLSDTARREIEGLMNSPMTPQQIRQVAAVLHNDLQNRIAGFDTHIGMVRQAIGAKTAPSQAEAAGPSRPQGVPMTVDEFLRRRRP